MRVLLRRLLSIRVWPLHIGGWLQDAVRDVRYSARQFRRSPQVGLAAVVTLVIGIGLNSVAFSVLNGLAFRPQVSHDPASFVHTYSTVTGDAQRLWHGTPTKGTLETYDALRTGARTLSAVTGSVWTTFTIQDVQAMRLRGKFVTCNYISAHMGPMLRGRGFAESDCSTAAEPVAVLSQLSWTTRFQRDPAIVGRTLNLNNRLVTVIGIAPDDVVGEPLTPLILVPYTQGPSEYFRDPPSRHAWLDLSGRLVPGRSREEANAEVNVIANALDRLHPGRTTKILVTNGALSAIPGSGRGSPPIMELVLSGMLLVLMMVCTNVTTLLLARVEARRHEMQVRLSLGASRARLLRQLLTESLVLALSAGTLSLIVAYRLPRPIAQLLTEYPIGASFVVDWRVLTYTAGLSLTAACAIGLSPAFASLRLPVASRLFAKAADGAHTTTFLRGMLIAEQLAISLALLVGMGLILRSQNQLLKPDLPYDPTTVLVANIDLRSLEYSHYNALAFYDRLVPRLQKLPGIRLVAVSSLPLFQGQQRIVLKRDMNGAAGMSVHVRTVSSSYFAMTGVRLVSGRLFSREEERMIRRPTPIIVSDALARTLALRSDDVGRDLNLVDGRVVRLVGIVSDTSSVQPGKRDENMLYQSTGTGDMATASVLMTFTGNPQMLVPLVRRELQALEPQLFASMETVAVTIAQESERYAAVVKLTAIPAGLSVFLSIVGIFGVTAFVVAQRRRELGIRSALGAQPQNLVTMLLLSLRWPFLAGLTLGALLAITLTRLLQRGNLITDMAFADPWAYGSALLLLLCATAATFVPAFRATRAEPWQVLRND
jgi:predicted permease